MARLHRYPVAYIVKARHMDLKTKNQGKSEQVSGRFTIRSSAAEYVTLYRREHPDAEIWIHDVTRAEAQ